MATPLSGILNESWVRDAFLSEYAYKPEFFTDAFRRRLPTVESIKADVAKLRSVSAAGRVWIADRRMAIASVGPWRDTFIMRRMGEGYPAIISKRDLRNENDHSKVRSRHGTNDDNRHPDSDRE